MRARWSLGPTGLAAMLIALAALFLPACGGGGGSGPSNEATDGPPSCALSRSALGPYSPDTPLGETLSKSQAEARVARDGLDGFIAIHASGPWSLAWEIAERQLGSGIHTDLAWLDVSGELDNLYEDGDAFGFSGLRVSRSYQGKIEAEPDPLFVGIESDAKPNFADATCKVTSIMIGTSAQDDQLDLLDYIENAQAADAG